MGRGQWQNLHMHIGGWISMCFPKPQEVHWALQTMFGMNGRTYWALQTMVWMNSRTYWALQTVVGMTGRTYRALQTMVGMNGRTCRSSVWMDKQRHYGGTEKNLMSLYCRHSILLAYVREGEGGEQFFRPTCHCIIVASVSTTSSPIIIIVTFCSPWGP